MQSAGQHNLRDALRWRRVNIDLGLDISDDVSWRQAAVQLT